MIELYSPKQMLNASLSAYSEYPTLYVFLTEEIDLDGIDWLALVKSKNSTKASSLSVGDLLSFVGVTDDNLWACYKPVASNPTEEVLLAPYTRRFSHFTASATNTFTSKLDAPPVQCLTLILDSYNLNTGAIANNAVASALHRLTSSLLYSSIVASSVGLRDSDAEIILLADEFKKGNEYRISDVEIDIVFGEEE